MTGSESKPPEPVIARSLRQLRLLAARYPGALLLTGVLCGIVPATAGFGPLSWLPTLTGAAVAALLLRPRSLLRFLPAAAAGLLAAAWTDYRSADSYRRIIDRENCGAEIIFTVTDPGCAGSAVPWLESPGWIHGTVSRLRLTAAAPWHEVSGRLAVTLPDDAPPPACGDVLRLRGAFFAPPENYRQTLVFLPGSQTKTAALPAFDFRAYLRSRGVYHLFRAREAVVAGHVETPATLLLRLRNLLLRRTGEGIASEPHRNLIAALIFGCRQGLDWRTRQSFIRTGTVHIFTVSGFHVGILAWLLLLMLRGVPFTARHLLVPVLLLGYVATTGFNPPAVRTLMMFATWSVCRGLLLKTPALNLIFLAATALLLYNPFYLHDLGFQYSFTVVAFLVAASGPISSWCAGIGEHCQWIPATAVTWRMRLRTALLRRFGATAAACAVAWLASSGISLYYQGFLFPAAAALNLLIIPFVWLIFIGAGIKMILPPLPGLESVAGSALNGLVEAMSGLCVGADRVLETLYLSPPSAWAIGFFLVALMLVVGSGTSRWAFLTGAALLALLPFGWYCRDRLQPPSLTFITGRGNPPALFFHDPARRFTVAVNAPGGDAPRLTAARLRQSGGGRIDLLVAAGATRDYCAGLRQLGSAAGIRELALPRPHGSSTAARVMPELTADGTAVTLLPPREDEFRFRTPLLLLSRQKETLRFEYVPPGFKITAGYRRDDCGGVRLEAGSARSAPWSVELDNSAVLEVKTCLIR